MLRKGCSVRPLLRRRQISVSATVKKFYSTPSHLSELGFHPSSPQSFSFRRSFALLHDLNSSANFDTRKDNSTEADGRGVDNRYASVQSNTDAKTLALSKNFGAPSMNIPFSNDSDCFFKTGLKTKCIRYDSMPRGIMNHQHLYSFKPHLSHLAQIRMVNTSASGGSNKQDKNKNRTFLKESNIEGTGTYGRLESVGGGRLSSFVDHVNQRIPKMEWHLSDLVSVVGTGILFLTIIFTPIVINQMKQSGNLYNDIDVEDAIRKQMEFVQKEIHSENDFLNPLAENYKEDKNKSTGNTADVVAEVLNSKALQSAITSLVTQLVGSAQFQNACKQLLKNLWNDLVHDPETTAQVVQLLNTAIKDEQIKRSFKELITELLKDKEVYDELTSLIVRLGDEKEILSATQALLTESAHKALNDPEILDHSMEFATDVVGDDVVQRTSGEALRNTVTYAVRPGLSAFLSVIGIGLLAFSLTALGNARISALEVKEIDATASVVIKNIGESAIDAFVKFLAVPGQMLSSIGSVAIGVLTLPFKILRRAQTSIEKVRSTSVNIVFSAFSEISAYPMIIWHKIESALGRAILALGNVNGYLLIGTSEALSRIILLPSMLLRYTSLGMSRLSELISNRTRAVGAMFLESVLGKMYFSFLDALLLSQSFCKKIFFITRNTMDSVGKKVSLANWYSSGLVWLSKVGGTIGPKISSFISVLILKLQKLLYRGSKGDTGISSSG